MNLKTALSTALLASVLAFTSTSVAQPAPNLPSPSPTGTLKQRVGLTDVEIIYSRPGVKGRKIFGELVPYGTLWRTGANAATKITFSTAIKLNGMDVPAGSYALFTIPGETEWTIILNKVAVQNGATAYDEKQDLVRFKVKPAQLTDIVETFTIGINNITDDSASIDLSWEKTRVSLKIGLDLKAQLVPQIEQFMASNAASKPYYQAATYYFDNGQDLQKAAKWVDAAIAEREAYYSVNLKAKILAKLGDKAGAIAAAKRSTELAITAKDTGYVKLNADLIASLK